jgi:protein O-mannosyl-transferase
MVRFAPFAALLLTTFLAYWPALRGEMVWDDSSHVTAPNLQSFHGLWRIWFELGATQQYYPLLHSAFWLQHRLWGDAVLGYHLVNVLLHGICACLVVLIVRRLALPGAWFAGFLFALHPVCVEAVAWISEQKSTLSGVFCLAALLVYLGFDQSRDRRSYFLALGLFVLALLSKTVTATLPGVLLVIFWWQRGRLNWRRDILPLVPWFAIAVPMGLFTAWVERTYIGAVGSDFQLSLLQRFLIAGRLIWFYAAKLLLPFGLSFSYPRWAIDPSDLSQFFYLAGVIALSVVLLVVSRRNRGPLAAFLVFAGTLSPVLGFLNVLPFRYSWAADHFQYLACLGLLIPFAAWSTAAAGQFLAKGSHGAQLAAAAAVVGLAVLTMQQSATYRDEETLYRSALARNPSSWLTHNNLGTVLEKKPGQLREAVAEFKTAIDLHPIYDAQAHFNLAGAYAQLGTPEDISQAIAEYQAGLRMEPENAGAHLNLGTLLAGIPGRTGDAKSEFQKAAELDPNSAHAHANLGSLLAQAGQLPEAIGEFETAVRLDPNLAEAHFLLGAALEEMPGRTAEAIAEYRAALQIRPDYQPAQESLQELLGSR